MHHLTTEQVYDLAQKVVRGDGFTEENAQAMLHIGQCEECYQLLQCMMALIYTTERVGPLIQPAGPSRSVQGANITLVTDRTAPALNQVLPKGGWTFAEATQPESEHIQTLADIHNRHTFVKYDSNENLLTVQIDGADSEMPRGFLRAGNGTMSKLTFEKQEQLYRSQIPGLEDPEYKLILEK